MRYLSLALINIRPNESAWSKPLHSRYEYPLPLLAMIWDWEDSNDATDTSISGALSFGEISLISSSSEVFSLVCCLDIGPEEEPCKLSSSCNSCFAFSSVSVSSLADPSEIGEGRLAGTSLTKPVPAESLITEELDFFTNRQPKPDGFSPKTLKKEQTRKSGLKRERPRVSISLGPKPQASSKTCHPFSRAMFIQRKYQRKAFPNLRNISEMEGKKMMLRQL